MYSISNTTDLSCLKSFMFINYEKHTSKTEKPLHNDLNEKKPNIYVDYNKQQCKYNDKPKYFADDKLFWYIYTIINKVSIYDMINNNKFLLEKQTKMEIYNKLKDYSTIIKQRKLKKSTLQSELLDSVPISLYTFISLLIIYNIKTIIIFDHSYTLTHPDDMDSFTSIKISKNGKIYNIEECNIDIHKIQDEYYYIDNVHKPIKAFSTVKIDDLLTITKKLGLSHMKNNLKKNKRQLYDDIVVKLNI